jgi:hypothetical protein
MVGFVLGVLLGCGGPSDDKISGGGAGVPAVPTGADACKLLTPDEIAQAVGNPVKDSAYSVGTHLSWDTEKLEQVSVVLSVWVQGSPAVDGLCQAVRQAQDGRSISGLGEAAKWSYRSSTLADSADLEACDGKGWIGLSLSGKKDEAALEAAARALAEKVISRL